MEFRQIVNYDALILVSLIWFLGKFVRYAFPPLFETLQSTYSVSNTVVGAAFTGFMVVYALMQFPSGVVADRIGAVHVVVAGATIAGLGSLALVIDSPLPVLVAAMLIIGVGTGVHKTVAVRLIARVYPGHTGRALGAHDTLGAFGGVAAPTAVVVFLSAPPTAAWIIHRLPGADWRGVFLLTGTTALVLALAFGLRFRGQLPSENGEVNVDDSSQEPATADYLALFRNRRFGAFVLVTIGVSFAHNGMIAFLPLYLSQVSGLTTTTAGILYSLFFWVTFVQLATGDISDRVGRFPVMVLTGGLATAALWGIVLSPGVGPLTLGALIALLGVGAHGFQPVRGAYLMELLPERLAGGGLGVVRTLLMGAGSLAPGIVGIIADASGFRVAFGLLAAAIALATVGAVGLWASEP